VRAINGGAAKKSGKKSPNRFQKQRNGLLALVHIAKKQLGLPDHLYREVLKNYGVSSAAALSIPELENLVQHFERRGFVKKPRAKSKGRRVKDQAEALRDRIRAEAAKIENGEERLKGLVKKVAGVDELDWCRNVGHLKRILKILGEIVISDR